LAPIQNKGGAGVKFFLSVVGLGVGLALGGGLLYGLFTSETARLVTMFLLGAFLFGSTVLLTTLFINRQWARVVGEQRTTHNHRYQINHPQLPPPAWEQSPVQPQPELLPPLPDKAKIWESVNLEEDPEDEIIA
jgi:hypothetical protein